MKTNLTIFSFLTAFVAFGNCAFGESPAPSLEPETIAGTRMRVDWPRLVSGNNLELPKLPANHTDSLRLGNGDIGVAVYAVPECLVLFVGKNDLLMGDSTGLVSPLRPNFSTRASIFDPLLI